MLTVKVGQVACLGEKRNVCLGKGEREKGERKRERKRGQVREEERKRKRQKEGKKKERKEKKERFFFLRYDVATYSFNYLCIPFLWLPVYCDLTELIAQGKQTRDPAPKLTRKNIPKQIGRAHV